ncbi:hypothetical protein B0H14DRAFT_3491392 [Mycena olivaceomarginata]|nr:hypothetical protein B0H14DRAFT_3491392 [Mycena olivaceomarginata]
MHHPNRGGRGRGVHGTRSQVSSGADFLEDITLTADVGVYFSATLGKRREELLNVSHKKRKLQPQELDDTLAEWKPVNPDVHDWDDTPDADDDLASESSALLLPLFLGNAKPTRAQRIRWVCGGQRLISSWTSSFATMVWGTTTALIWAVPYVHVAMPRATTPPMQYGYSSVEWNGNYWVDITLRELGFVYQIGHGGMPCRFPDPRLLTMTVIELPVIHRVSYRYCKCKMADTTTNVQQLLRNGWYPATITDPATCATFTTLETFRLQNVVANMNANDFITAIERQTNATVSTGMDWLPHRYKEFMRMSRQWAYLKRAKRAGRAHDSTGVAGTAQRELAVRCWACPHDGRNLPDGWRNVDKKFRFLYMLLVALDANFKLKNRMRQNERPDPSLGPGLGYFVDSAKYRRHLRKYVPEKDISTCIAFAALLQKDTRGRLGCERLAWKGERFANMDFIVMGALAGFALMWLTISYDISCQWKINLAKRNAMMPDDMKLPLDTIKLEFQAGVGKSDGEGVERTWAVLNPASYHTKDMGKGNRMDTLEDKIDSHNYLKNLGLGDALRRKLAVARTERDRQVQAFKDVCETVEQEVMDKWQGEIDTWLKDSSKPNPYIVERKDGPTEAQVRLQLKQDEEKELRIEQNQRRIIAEVAGTALVAADREQKIQELRLTTLKKIATFRKLQAIYMPGAASAIETDEAGRDPDEPSTRCIKNLPDMEVKMRIAQCDNALVVMRGRLHAKRHLITFRNENITGQIKSTKARTLIGQVGDRDGYAPHFRPLRETNIRLEGDNGESDAAAKKKLAMISAGRGARAPRTAPGQSKRTMSWIWTVKAGSGDAERDLHDSVRVEWARAKARKTRWVEEVMILEEEMRRTLRYLEWQAIWWEVRVDSRPGATVQVRAGVRAYALKQAALYRRLAKHFKAEWETNAGGS